MNDLKADIIVDAKGLACPMPIVKAKKTMNDAASGNVLEVQSTDRGSQADLKAWAESSGHQYLGTLTEGEVFKHYLRKLSSAETVEKKFPNTVQNDELVERIKVENTVLLDVRENAEYTFNHIPGSISMPLEEIDKRAFELNKNSEIFVICQTGNRSDLVSQKLQDKGFTKVYNVIPGMSQWSGIVEGINNRG